MGKGSVDSTIVSSQINRQPTAMTSYAWALNAPVVCSHAVSAASCLLGLLTGLSSGLTFEVAVVPNLFSANDFGNALSLGVPYDVVR